MDILFELYAILESRKQADPASSYTASLYGSGTPGISRKVMEEAYETVEAALLQENIGKKQSPPETLVQEIADLWYHTLVLACHQNLKLEDILQTLKKRKGKSGYEAKHNREKR